MEKRYRLAHSGQFKRVRSEGRSWSHPLLVLCALENGLPYSRFGFSVGKHVGKAVVRNRIKRLMREAVRARLTCVSPGWDVVLIARAEIANADLSRIGEALDFLLRRAKLIAEPLDVYK